VNNRTASATAAKGPTIPQTKDEGASGQDRELGVCCGS
jgi:hypothetical protein